MFSNRKVDVGYIVVFVAAWFLTGAARLHGDTAAAEGNKPWKVEGKLVGKPRGLDVLDSKKSQTLPDLVIKFQPIDIVGFIL
jgi:hypothetical protein